MLLLIKKEKERKRKRFFERSKNNHFAGFNKMVEAKRRATNAAQFASYYRTAKNNFTEQSETNHSTRKATQNHSKPLHGGFCIQADRENTERKITP